VLEHKSGNISETRRDRGKVTMEDLKELTIALSNGTILEPLGPPLSQDGVSNPQNSNRYYLRNIKFGWRINRVHPNKSPLKIFVKGAWAYSGTAQIFGGTPNYPRNGKSYELQILYAYCKLGADQEPPYPYSLCADPLFWPLMSLISIHAQFILLTRGNTGY